MPKELGSVANACRLEAMNGGVLQVMSIVHFPSWPYLLDKFLAETIRPNAINLTKPFANESIVLFICSFLTATLDNHAAQASLRG